MRECPNCKKVNLTTRKFCIRCGSSLLKSPKTRPTEAEPTIPASTIPFATSSTKVEPPSPLTEDKWVRPSEVAKDRVRHIGHSSTESEMEKAMRAFARADEIGFDEVGEGIIETRMLRASEVKELLEGPRDMGIMEPTEIPEDVVGMPADSEAPIRPPSTEDMEQQILGQWSTLIDREPTSEPEPATIEPPESPIRISVRDSSGFSSARYSESSTELMEEEPVISPEIEVPTAPEPILEPVIKDEPEEVVLSAEHVITCPQCKSVITIDDYEYPAEIYSAMGDARLKQAKYLIVQGREHDAKRIVKIARVLFEKANDGDGLAQIEQLDDTLS